MEDRIVTDEIIGDFILEYAMIKNNRIFSLHVYCKKCHHRYHWHYMPYEQALKCKCKYCG